MSSLEALEREILSNGKGVSRRIEKLLKSFSEREKKKNPKAFHLGESLMNSAKQTPSLMFFVPKPINFTEFLGLISKTISRRI